MKKLFVAAIAAIISFGGMNTFAQTEIQNPVQKEQTGKCTENKCNADKKQCNQKAFEGIQLTADQQTRINELNQKQAQKMKEARAQMKDRKKEMKKQCAESRKAAKREYLNEIKQILTPEQYVAYLENIALNQHHNKAFMHNKNVRVKNHRHHRDGKACKMGDRRVRTEQGK